MTANHRRDSRSVFVSMKAIYFTIVDEKASYIGEKASYISEKGKCDVKFAD